MIAPPNTQFGGKVRVASYFVNPNQNSNDNLSLTVLDGSAGTNMVWPVAKGQTNQPIFASGNTVRLKIENNNAESVLVKVGDKFFDHRSAELVEDFEAALFQKVSDLTNGTTQAIMLPIDASNEIVVWILEIVEQADPPAPGVDPPTPVVPLPSTAFSTFTIRPAKPNEPFPPIITAVANGKFGTPKTFITSEAYVFYGDAPYVRLHGESGAKGELSFVLLDGDGNELETGIVNQNIETVSADLGTWRAEFNLSTPLPTREAKLIVLRKKNDNHNYSEFPINFTTAAFTPIPPATKVAVFDNIGVKVGGNTVTANTESGVFQVNKTEVELAGTGTIPKDVVLVAYTGGTVVGATIGTGSAAEWRIKLKDLKQGRQEFTVALMQADKLRTERPSAPVPIFVRTAGPRVVDLEPKNFGTAPGIYAVTISFDQRNPIATNFATLDATDKLKAVFSIVPSGGTGVFTSGKEALRPTAATFDSTRNAVTVTFAPFPADIYQLRISSDQIQDVYGNLLIGDNGKQGTAFTKKLGNGAAIGQAQLATFTPDESPTVRPGISGSTGDYVAFPEYVRRPDVESGFNPNDKVETRVVRLYYYRDAHRIAQIVNRKVKSYNRAAVDTHRQLADKARNQANQLTTVRQIAERNAIIMAKKSRERENELQRAENSLNNAIQQLANYRRDNPDADPTSDPTIRQFESLVNSFSEQVYNSRAEVQNLRDEEVQANEHIQQAEAQEKLAREEQFRREVAAAHSDPDTYAPGTLNSADPVEQVSVSVVGEGLLQLRGPLKGINLIRTAIDQLDSPVGQVRISLHTIQINGEHADRIEVVAKQVQTYIDHARFLTMHSAEMLRKSVVQVASQKAEEASALFPGETQMDRDERYIMAFFGKDFIDELKAMDSEFLHTGNKLLSLHSMDTTSLASALNLMALAKNSTRQEIFATFDEMLQCQLPQAEANYFAAGWTCPKQKHSRFHRCKNCQPEYCSMAQNAKFESLRGFFDTQVSNDDTMTPLQREFIRLAQIFKSRLITELEYKQRVMERAIIEERLGDRTKELREAKEKEKVANVALKKAQQDTIEGRIKIITLVKQIEQAIRLQVNETLRNAVKLQSVFNEILDTHLRAVETKSTEVFTATIAGEPVSYTKQGARGGYIDFIRPNGVEAIHRAYADLGQDMKDLYQLLEFLDSLQVESPFATELAELNTYVNSMAIPLKFGVREEPNWITFSQLKFADEVGEILNEFADTEYGPAKLLVDEFSAVLQNKLEDILASLTARDAANVDLAYKAWLGLKNQILVPLQTTTFSSIDTVDIDEEFKKMLGNGVRLELAEMEATRSRRPLDHKKFLDMLVDDLEEKYIELLDGTRAHVANIDNYLKRVTTAIDDDFNTQFYHPAFKYIREASVSYDVQFGQTETTTLLANNREFAKADPSATMEFDLPKRDILIAEGINGAKAMINDVGALANDPTFLAMTKLNGPNPGSSPNPGSTGGNAVVRNVLPGLSGMTSEQVMSQNSNGGQQFGSNLENLIPDPAVYKFETGTGFEIRPVIQPDGQAVVFDFNYMYTTNIREPIRADEKHLGRVKRHYVDTDVQLSNFELREVSRYNVALKAARTSRGVPLLEDVPGIGVLFRPLPSDENSLQQNLIMAQATIFPTLFDLMGLRWAPVVSDLDPMKLSTSDFVVRNRHRMLENRVYDVSSSYVDEFLRVPEAERRMDLYRSQDTVPQIHPNGYMGPGLNLQDSHMREGYQPTRAYPVEPFVPNRSIEGASNPMHRRPPREFYDEHRSSAPPDPNGIREPNGIRKLRGR